MTKIRKIDEKKKKMSRETAHAALSRFDKKNQFLQILNAEFRIH